MSDSPAATLFRIACLRCEREILVHPDWVGREVDCPHCYSAQRVPAASPDGRTVEGLAPTLAPGRVFNFPCPRCDCLLEAHTGMSGQMARCPTCAARFYVPDVHPRTGLPKAVLALSDEVAPPTTDAIRPPTGRPTTPDHFGRQEQPVAARPKRGAGAARGVVPQSASGPLPAKQAPAAAPTEPVAPKQAIPKDEPETPQPMHAYGASGHQAPVFVRGAGGELEIRCPRCGRTSNVDADRCHSCGAPFVLEAAPTARGAATAGWSSAAMTCGLLGLLLFPLILPGLLAVYFGGRSLAAGFSQASIGALLGMILGALGVAGGIVFWANI